MKIIHKKSLNVQEEVENLNHLKRKLEILLKQRKIQLATNNQITLILGKMQSSITHLRDIPTEKKEDLYFKKSYMYSMESEFSRLRIKFLQILRSEQNKK